MILMLYIVAGTMIVPLNAKNFIISIDESDLEMIKQEQAIERKNEIQEDTEMNARKQNELVVREEEDSSRSQTDDHQTKKTLKLSITSNDYQPSLGKDPFLK